MLPVMDANPDRVIMLASRLGIGICEIAFAYIRNFEILQRYKDTTSLVTTAGFLCHAAEMNLPNDFTKEQQHRFRVAVTEVVATKVAANPCAAKILQRILMARCSGFFEALVFALNGDLTANNNYFAAGLLAARSDIFMKDIGLGSETLQFMKDKFGLSEADQMRLERSQTDPRYVGIDPSTFLAMTPIVVGLSFDMHNYIKASA